MNNYSQLLAGNEFIEDLNDFELIYSYVRTVNGGCQWKCTYPDGNYSLAMVYKINPTQQDIIDAIDAANEKR